MAALLIPSDIAAATASSIAWASSSTTEVYAIGDNKKNIATMNNNIFI